MGDHIKIRQEYRLVSTSKHEEAHVLLDNMTKNKSIIEGLKGELIK